MATPASTLPTHSAYILLRDLLLDETRYSVQLATEAQEAQHTSTLFVACVEPDTAVEDVRALYRKGEVHPAECTGICCTGTKMELMKVVGNFTTDPTEEETQMKRFFLEQDAHGIQSRYTDKVRWLSSLSVQKTQMEEQYAQEQAAKAATETVTETAAPTADTPIPL
jgi:hypothetical protein